MIYDIFLYCPMIVTLMWAIILLIFPNKTLARQMLGIFMALNFGLFLSHIFYYKQLIEYYLPFDLIFITCSLSVFPSYYLYIKYLSNNESSRLEIIKLYYPTIIILTATSLVYILMDKVQRHQYIENIIFNNELLMSSPPIFRVQYSLTLLLQTIYATQIIYFFFKIRSILKRHKEAVEALYCEYHTRRYGWQQKLLYSYTVISIICIPANFLGRYFFLQSSFCLVSIACLFSILLFIIAYLGNIQKSIIPQSHTANIPSPCTSEKLEQLHQTIEQALAVQKLYKNPSLKIDDLSKALSSNRTYVSEVINHKHHCSFNKYINHYRLSEAKSILDHPELQKLTIETIATEVGFGSIHTFIRAFKEEEGISPSLYRERARTTKVS